MGTSESGQLPSETTEERVPAHKQSPALTFQSEHYPASWSGKVPKRIRMAKTVSSDIPFRPLMVAGNNREYDAWTNSHGAVAAILSDGEMLGVKPYEFEVIEWY